jgi:hypothetical protein
VFKARTDTAVIDTLYFTFALLKSLPVMGAGESQRLNSDFIPELDELGVRSTFEMWPRSRTRHQPNASNATAKPASPMIVIVIQIQSNLSNFMGTISDVISPPQTTAIMFYSPARPIVVSRERENPQAGCSRHPMSDPRAIRTVNRAQKCPGRSWVDKPDYGI